MAEKILHQRNEKLALALELSVLNNKQLCLLVGINEATLYRLLNQQHQPGNRIVRELCRLMRATPKELGLNYD